MTENNIGRISKDDLEYIEALAQGYEGFLTLSSGKLTYVRQPQKNPEEIGNALHLICERMKQDERNRDENSNS